MTTYGNLWQLMATYGNLNLWQLMATYDNLWQHISIAPYGNFWQHMVTFAKYGNPVSTFVPPLVEKLKICDATSISDAVYFE